MSILKPYYRIVRPLKQPMSFEYVLDSRYCQERSSLCKAYQIIQQDLEKIFEYVEPCDNNCDNNKAVYSHRMFELLLRCATEFEANCKGILMANGYSSNSMNITDYSKLEQATKLSEYKVKLQYWYPHPLELEPFKEWSKGYSLSWYKAYNQVKHNRNSNFDKSNLWNLINALAGLLCILYSQFEFQCANFYRTIESYSFNDGIIGLNGIIFDIQPPQTWSDSEVYDFAWGSLKQLSYPYNKFNFI
ncbi:MAG TPA: hypothetical protein VK184_05885 [Nostocaceae cyanobacterium]|nr:hypothetical protein [Nostocaceae cyanobacterium]